MQLTIYYYLSEVKCTFNLDTEISTVDIIAEKQIARLLWWSTDFKQLQQIIELTVHVTTYCHVALAVH